jgi:predicted transcriptional regulator
MEFQETNREMMTASFAAIQGEAHLKEAYEAIKKNLEGPPHAPGLVVADGAGKYAGLFTLDDLMKELAGLYRQACDQPGRKKGWGESFFNLCELMGIKKVGELMGAKKWSVRADASFATACELILGKRLHLVAVVDADSRPVGIITRRKVLLEIAPRMFP